MCDGTAGKAPDFGLNHTSKHEVYKATMLRRQPDFGRLWLLFDSGVDRRWPPRPRSAPNVSPGHGDHLRPPSTPTRRPTSIVSFGFGLLRPPLSSNRTYKGENSHLFKIRIRFSCSKTKKVT